MLFAFFWLIYNNNYVSDDIAVRTYTVYRIVHLASFPSHTFREVEPGGVFIKPHLYSPRRQIDYGFRLWQQLIGRQLCF